MAAKKLNDKMSMKISGAFFTATEWPFISESEYKSHRNPWVGFSGRKIDRKDNNASQEEFIGGLTPARSGKLRWVPTNNKGIYIPERDRYYSTENGWQEEEQGQGALQGEHKVPAQEAHHHVAHRGPADPAFVRRHRRAHLLLQRLRRRRRAQAAHQREADADRKAKGARRPQRFRQGGRETPARPAAPAPPLIYVCPTTQSASLSLLCGA